MVLKMENRKETRALRVRRHTTRRRSLKERVPKDILAPIPARVVRKFSIIVVYNFQV